MKVLDLAIVLFLISIFPLPLMAGGAFSTTPDGIPVLWNDVPVTWRAETGPLKGSEDDCAGGGGGGQDAGGCQLAPSQLVCNPEAIQMVDSAFKTWQNAPNVSIDIQQGPSLGADVNFFNLEDFFVGVFLDGTIPSNVTAAGCYDNDPNTECLNSVIFDNSIDPQLSLIAAVAGECSQFGIFALTAILPVQENNAQQTILSPNLRSSQIIISSTCLDPVNPPDANCGGGCPISLSKTQMQGTITHEVGHFLGLDHTCVNKEAFIDCNAATEEQVPSMIGLFCPAANLNTLHRDDIATMGTFYPSNNFSTSTCSITGVARTSDNEPQRCLEVVARDVGNPENNAVASISGVFANRFTQGNQNLSGQQGKTVENCDASDAVCGTYEIAGLVPGTYKMTVQDFTGVEGFVLEPCTPALAESLIGDTDINDPNNPTVIVCNPSDPNARNFSVDVIAN